MATELPAAQSWLAQAIARLRDGSKTDTPELDAQLILCDVLGITRAHLYAFPETTLSDTQLIKLQAHLTRRLQGEPLAYITGTRDFWNAELVIHSGTLVPRTDTEILVEKALELAPFAPQGTIADLGTGSGAIAIAMASELPSRAILAVEYSARALANARLNVRTQRADNVTLIHASWLNAVAGQSLAMILSNPPYLSSSDPHLPSLQHEPFEALIGGISGLEDIQHIVVDSLRAGKANAPLIVEHGFEQGPAVRSLLCDNGYNKVDTACDLAGHERISFGFVPH